jgi:hypothetical protein
MQQRIHHCCSSRWEISCFWCEGANLGYVEAITAADIARGRERARGSHAERRFAWRSFCYPVAAVAQAWLSATSRNATSTTPRGNAPPSTLETMIHAQKYRGWLGATVDQANFVIDADLNMYKTAVQNCSELHTNPRLNTKILELSGSCFSLSGATSFVTWGRVGGWVVPDAST